MKARPKDVTRATPMVCCWAASRAVQKDRAFWWVWMSDVTVGCEWVSKWAVQRGTARVDWLAEQTTVGCWDALTWEQELACGSLVPLLEWRWVVQRVMSGLNWVDTMAVCWAELMAVLMAGTWAVRLDI